MAKKKEIYTYKAPWTTYSLAWNRSGLPGEKFKLAVGSFKEEYANTIKIIQLDINAEINEASENNSDDTQTYFNEVCSCEHPYPATKILWAPQSHLTSGKSSSKNLLATTGDYLRLWAIDDNNKMNSEALMNNSRHQEYCSPLTSFDWNEVDPNIIGTSSIDSTCTIWDLEKQTPRTQLIAHEKEVYDISFAAGRDIFGTVGADGSVRMFDLRSLEHSTILFESPDMSPLLKIAWNKQDPNYVATILTDSPKAVIIDIRVPSIPMTELMGHQAALNGISWAPHSAHHICTVGDDSQALIWDITSKVRPIEDPILAYSAAAEINQLQWCGLHEDWVAVCYDKYLQILRV